jgi:hypothetical protein
MSCSLKNPRMEVSRDDPFKKIFIG